MSVTTIDRRNEKRPVWRATWSQMSWANGAGHAASTGTATDFNGYITQLVAVISAATDDPDVVFTITEDSVTIYTSDAQDDGQTVVLTPNKYVSGSIAVAADPSADAGTSGLTVDIKLYGT